MALSDPTKRPEPATPVIDATTLSAIWDAHADRLLLIARSIGGPAEDAVQEAFVALASQDVLPDEPMAWLVRVTRNRLMQWHRGKFRRRAREIVASERSWFDHDTLHIEQQLDAREVTIALQSLSSPQREVIVMHIWGEMTFDAIADVIGGSRASAHRAFQRGLRDLKRKYERGSDFDSMRLCNE